MWHGNTIEENSCVICYLSALLVISKGMQAVSFCCNKALHFLTEVASYHSHNGCC